MRIALIAFLALIALPLPAAADTRVTCYDTGGLVISGMAGLPEDVYASVSGSSKKFKVPGEWIEADKKSYFSSEEAVFVVGKETSFKINVGDKSWTAKCPAFVFSCRIINISLDTCFTKDGQFTGRFYAYNYKLGNQSLRFEKPYLLTYKVTGNDKKELTRGPEIVSPELRNISISVSRQLTYNKYSLRWNTTRNITRFVVRYQECEKQVYNFHRSTNCGDKPGCKSDGQCGNDETCEDGYCSKLSCGQCAYVKDRECVKRECCANDDCNDEQFCVKNYCLKVSCLPGEKIENHTCANPGCKEKEVFVNRTCMKECADDEAAEGEACKKLDCANDEAAKNHKCEKLQCRENEKAENGKCSKIKCGAMQKLKGNKCVNAIADFFSSLFGGKSAPADS